MHPFRAGFLSKRDIDNILAFIESRRDK